MAAEDIARGGRCCRLPLGTEYWGLGDALFEVVERRRPDKAIATTRSAAELGSGRGRGGEFAAMIWWGCDGRFSCYAAGPVVGRLPVMVLTFRFSQKKLRRIGTF